MARKNDVVEKKAKAPEEKIKMNGESNQPDEHVIDSIEEGKELMEDLFEKTETYIKTSVEVYKLKATDKLSAVVASLVARLVVVIFILLFFFMINIGLAIWIGDAMGHVYYGFFIVAAVYALGAVIFYIYRDPVIKNPIINSIISQVLKEDPNE